MTVPVEGLPPTTDVGLSATALTVGAVTERAALADPPLTLAPMLAVVRVPTGMVVTANVAVVAPPATDAVPGTVAAPLSDVSVTVKPAVGAGLDSVTVAVEPEPPTTEVGFSATVATFGAVIANDALAFVPLNVVVIPAVALAATAVVVIVKVPEVAPAAIVADPGVAAALSDVEVIVSPPTGAGLLIVTVPVEEVPPTTVAGFKLTELTVGAVIARAAA